MGSKLKTGQKELSAIALHTPTAEHGMSVYELIKACPPLDTNSAYCNLLQCCHFAETSVLATLDGEAVGFISGYRLPGKPNRLFIWQVAVSEKARGQGLAKSMLRNLLQRESCQGVSYIETTITESNAASWALFEALARELNTGITRSVMFDRERHFNGAHDTEMLAEIGPF